MNPYVKIVGNVIDQIKKFDKSRLASDFAEILTELSKLITTLGATYLKPILIDMKNNYEGIMDDPDIEIDGPDCFEDEDMQSSTKWGCLTIMFFAHFLQPIMADQIAPPDAANKAYKQILAPVHNAVQRGIFEKILTFIPNMEQFKIQTNIQFDQKIKETINLFKQSVEQVCKPVYKWACDEQEEEDED